MGSGVIVSADGIVITNDHVISRAEIIKIVLNDDRSFTANTIVRDPLHDLAALKIDLHSGPDDEKPKFVKFFVEPMRKNSKLYFSIRGASCGFY